MTTTVPTTRKTRPLAIATVAALLASVLFFATPAAAAGTIAAPEITRVTTSPGKVDMVFTEVSGAAGYNVYRNGKYLETINGSPYDDRTTQRTNHRYYITAFDSSKQVFSTRSNEITANTTKNTTWPAASSSPAPAPNNSSGSNNTPSSLAAPEITRVATSPGKVDMVFTEVSGAAGYNVYRNGKYLETINGSPYDDRTTQRTNHRYYITAFDSSKQVFSTRSNEITANTTKNTTWPNGAPPTSPEQYPSDPDPQPTTPSEPVFLDLSARTRSDGKVNLTWDRNSFSGTVTVTRIAAASPDDILDLGWADTDSSRVVGVIANRANLFFVYAQNGSGDLLAQSQVVTASGACFALCTDAERADFEEEWLSAQYARDRSRLVQKVIQVVVRVSKECRGDCSLDDVWHFFTDNPVHQAADEQIESFIQDGYVVTGTNEAGGIVTTHLEGPNGTITITENPGTFGHDGTITIHQVESQNAGNHVTTTTTSLTVTETMTGVQTTGEETVVIEEKDPYTGNWRQTRTTVYTIDKNGKRSVKSSYCQGQCSSSTGDGGSNCANSLDCAEDPLPGSTTNVEEFTGGIQGTPNEQTGGGGDTTGQGSNSLTEHSETTTHSGSAPGNTGSHEEVGNTGLSGAAG